MQILLINLPWHFTQPQLIPDIPWGLGVVAAVLEQNGYQVSILDINSLGLNKEEVVKEIKTKQFELVGITLFIGDLDYLKWLCQIIKNYHSYVPIIVGGPLISVAPQIIMEYIPQIGIGVIGEGDETIIELIQAIENKGRFENLENITGIAYRSNNKVRLTRVRNPIHNLDNIPWPAWHLFPIIKSIQHKENIKSGPGNPLLVKISHMTIRTTRGCPFRCDFCATSKLFPIFRSRSVSQIIKQIKKLHKVYQLKAIWFNDDMFTFNRQRVVEICQALVKLNLSWGCMTRTQLLDKGLISLMKKSDCILIRPGIESLSQRVLNLSHKGVKIQQDLATIDLIQKARIEVQPFIIVGLPEETKNSLQTTLNFIRHTGIQPISSLLLPLPGSKLYNQAKKQGRITDETQYVLKLGNARPDQLIVNLTDLPDEFLIQTFKQMQNINYN